MERHLGQKLEHGKVLVFSNDVKKKDKQQTTRTKLLLESNNIEYEEVDLTRMTADE